MQQQAQIASAIGGGPKSDQRYKFSVRRRCQKIQSFPRAYLLEGPVTEVQVILVAAAPALVAGIMRKGKK